MELHVAARVTSMMLALAATGGGAACHDATKPSSELNVLFIGNSLTLQNGLPGVVAALAAADGRSISVATDAVPGTALIDHVNYGDALSVIQGSSWDYVILQQGPSRYAICLDTTVMALQALDEAIRGVGGAPALLMVWPTVSDSGNGGFDIVRESYQEAAKAVDAMFLPAGEAWRIAWRTDPSLQLYGPDGFHPAPMGTFLAALVIYERLTGRDARDLPTSVPIGGLTVSEDTMRLLQEAAHEANQRYGSGDVPGLPLLPSPGPMIC
jgi:hypothetical protein